MKRPLKNLMSRRMIACPGAAMPLVLLAGLVSGCMGRQSFYGDVYASRLATYERWQRQQGHEAESMPAVKGKLMLEDAVKLAMLYNKPLQAVLQDKEIARGRVIESYSEVLPKVSGVAGYRRLDKVSSFTVGDRSVSIGALDNYSVDLQLRQPLFRGGAISAAIRAARIFAYLTDETVRNQVQATIHEVARDYYDALLAQQLYEVNREAVVSAEAHLKDVGTKFSNGAASRFDVLRAEVDVSLFRAEMLQQQNRLHLAETRLLKAMGVSQETQVRLGEKLTYEPVRPVLEQAVRIAHLNRPDLYQAEFGVRLQQEAVRIAMSRYWPTVDAVFTQGWARPDPHVSMRDAWSDRWEGGIRMEIPIFDGLGREGRLIQEKAALEKRKIELLDAEERALLEIQQALLSLRDAEEFVESQRLNLQRAQEGLRLAEVGYREGVNTEVEVVDARAALTRARGLHYQAIYDHTIARLAMQRAMGIMGPRAGESSVPSEAKVRPAHIEEFMGPAQPAAQPATQPAAQPAAQPATQPATQPAATRPRSSEGVEKR